MRADGTTDNTKITDDVHMMHIMMLSGNRETKAVVDWALCCGGNNRHFLEERQALLFLKLRSSIEPSQCMTYRFPVFSFSSFAPSGGPLAPQQPGTGTGSPVI